MEERAPYRVQRDEAYVRAENLLPYPAWVPPDASQVRGVMAKAGLEPRTLAEFVGVSRKEVNRWTTGQAVITYACWVILCQRAAVGYLDRWD
ncbi:transcriptional regulator [Pseudomonas hunanensis]|uniref:Transcriptional regulator n=1 Tax=Pseudomonas hunanensis TaxID=1247546 RepID=A0ABD6NB97_9PSED|nr:korC transcriptional regulator [uncultured bacterium]NWL45450.1 transcriptional regulator [Pseudomonas hunanensis]